MELSAARSIALLALFAVSPVPGPASLGAVEPENPLSLNRLVVIFIFLILFFLVLEIRSFVLVRSSYFFSIASLRTHFVPTHAAPHQRGNYSFKCRQKVGEKSPLPLGGRGVAQPTLERPP